MDSERTNLIEVVQHLVRALDEIVRDLEALGRNPTDVRQAVSGLRDIEYRLLSEVETSPPIAI